MQKRKGRIWGLLGIIVLYGILEGWSWLDEQDIDLGDAVTRLVQYFEDDDSANDAGWMEEEDADSDEMLPASAQKQEWDTGDAGYYEACLEPGNYTVGYDLFPGSYQLECRLDSAWIYVSDPEGTDWDYEVLYSEEYQDWVRENDEEYSGEYSAYSNVLELSEGQTLYIESVTESVWITGLKAEGAVLEKRDSQGLQTVHYQEGMEPGAGIPEGVYDLVLSNPDTGVVYLQVHGEDGMELYLTLGKDTPVIRGFLFRTAIRLNMRIMIPVQRLTLCRATEEMKKWQTSSVMRRLSMSGFWQSWSSRQKKKNRRKKISDGCSITLISSMSWIPLT